MILTACYHLFVFSSNNYDLAKTLMERVFFVADLRHNRMGPGVASSSIYSVCCINECEARVIFWF